MRAFAHPPDIRSPRSTWTQCLDLEPGSTLNLPNSGLTEINVHSNMIVRSPLGSDADLIVKYAGTNTVHVEASFKGDLFIAPNATVEIKYGPQVGTFFANQVEVHQDRIVTRRPLSAAVRAEFLPSTLVHQLGEVAPGTTGQAEIASAVLPRTIASCATNPVAFVSYQSSDVLRAQISLSSGFFARTQLPRLPISPTPPSASACLGAPLQGYPGGPRDPLYNYRVLPGGTGYYAVSPYTDNVMSRTSDGRVLELGFAYRSCQDPVPTQSASCPTVMGYLPDDADPANPGCDRSVDPHQCACSTITNPALCFYPKPANPNWTGATDVVCGCLDTTPMNGMNDTFWTCEDRRVEATGLSLRMSSDCGNAWSSQYLDMVTLGLLDGTDGGGTIDRPELYVDPYADRLFVSGSMTPKFGDLTAGAGGLSVMAVGEPKTAATADAISFSVYRNDEWDGGPQVMTTVPDEQARFTDGTLAPFVYVVQAHCGISSGFPLVDIDTPVGWQQVNLRLGRGDDFLCRTAAEPTVPIVNHVPNITVAGIASVPPKVRIAYPALNAAGQQVVRIFVVTLRSSNGYSELQGQVELEGSLEPGLASSHIVFPQLIPVDGVAGSDGRVDTPMVLRYAVLTGDNVNEQAQMLYSGLRSGGRFLGQSSLTNMFHDSMGNPVCGAIDPSSGQPIICGLGDYRYGAFFEKDGTTLRYFTPWTGEVAGKAGIHAIGAAIDVIPSP